MIVERVLLLPAHRDEKMSSSRGTNFYKIDAIRIFLGDKSCKTTRLLKENAQICINDPIHHKNKTRTGKNNKLDIYIITFTKKLRLK